MAAQLLEDDLETIYNCSHCFATGWLAPQAFSTGPRTLINKHPPIGRGRELFFVNINPRSTDNAPMEWAMEDLVHFRQFSRNRYQRGVYIPGNEPFYNLHAQICSGIFGHVPIEQIATIHELYLCASPNQRALPTGPSPCAERFLRPHVLAVEPRLIVTFGDSVADFFDTVPDARCVQIKLSDTLSVHVLAFPFPWSWNIALRQRVAAHTAACYRAIITGGPVPGPMQFSRPQSRKIKSYELRPLNPVVMKNISQMAPQAQACVHIMVGAGRRFYAPNELKSIFETQQNVLKSRQKPWGIFKYYRDDLRAAGAIDWTE
jgi:hypothetical protein